MDSNLAAIYDEHAPALYAWLVSLTSDEEDTRDVMQEVFCRLATHPRTLDDVQDARAFLLRMARNAAYDLFRRRSARQRTAETYQLERVSPFAAEEDPDAKVFGEALAGAMGELPAEQREVLHLKLWQGLTFERIGEVLAVSPDTAASRYRYGIDKLRGLLRPIFEELS